MIKYIIETFSKVDEQAKITGIAAIPRISRNNRLYLKSELAKADGLRVPLNWEHTDKIVGYVTYHYNQELEQLYYEGLIEDEATATLAKNKILFTSIEAEPREVKKQCFTAQDCMEIPIGLERWQLALTEMPGIPETTVKIIESYTRNISNIIEAQKNTSIMMEASINDVIKRIINELEQRIIAKYDLLLAWEELLKVEPTNQYYLEQIQMCKDDLRWLVNQYLELKNDVSESKNISKIINELSFKDVPTLKEIITNHKEVKVTLKVCSKCGKQKK